MTDLNEFKAMRLKTDAELEADLYAFRYRSAEIEDEQVRLAALGSAGLRSERLSREWNDLQDKIGNILVEQQLRRIRGTRTTGCK